jgi:hypothetical protein
MALLLLAQRTWRKAQVHQYPWPYRFVYGKAVPSP